MLGALWKQRLRWGRGNVQITTRFREVWFRRSKAHGLGGILFGLAWFCTLLLPIVMIVSASALVALYFIDSTIAWSVFRGLWIINALTFAFITALALAIDPATGRRVWREAILFPGAISRRDHDPLVLPVADPRRDRCRGFDDRRAPDVDDRHRADAVRVRVAGGLHARRGTAPAGGTARVATTRAHAASTSSATALSCCAVTFAAYLAELRHAEMRWDKTEKTGRVAVRS